MRAADPARVLVVDDDPVIREVVSAVLSDATCELLVARSGTEALDAAQLHRPHVVVLDVMMPGMNGFEVCRRIRALPELQGTVVVMLTALDTQTSRDEGMDSGADLYLTKPFSALDLLGAVHEAVARVVR
ncbi:MAG TPA: response regulator [Actinomycetota bacterium]|nr:response regulator [Actinomycetota bacterium]